LEILPSSKVGCATVAANSIKTLNAANAGKP
jgi:hypothetical protein